MCVVFLMATIGTCAQTWSTVSNSNELINAISNGAYIRLTSDITLSNYLDISTGIHVTLDLNGHALQRSLSVANADGHVIEVFANATLTLCDGSGNGSGLITGGRANNGGGICNYGTLNFEGGTISACYAGTTGGGIKNKVGLLALEGLTLSCLNAAGRSSSRTMPAAPPGPAPVSTSSCGRRSICCSGPRRSATAARVWFTPVRTVAFPGAVASRSSMPGKSIEETILKPICPFLTPHPQPACPGRLPRGISPWQFSLNGK